MPLSLHSAGIGRTGTIIVIDMIVDMISTKGESRFLLPGGVSPAARRQTLHVRDAGGSQ